MEEKTNVMRLLDQARAPYVPHFYKPDSGLTGTQIAAILGEPAATVFKTLVAQGKSGAFYAFLIPVAMELDLKLAAKAAGEKAIAMLPLKKLLPVTGYVHGGCSPIGMKKRMRHFIDETSSGCERISFSGGRVGAQVTMATDTALEVADLEVAPLAKKTVQESM